MVSLPHWPNSAISNVTKYDLSRIERLLELLSFPHLKLPPIIHIAGTNGKGSTSALLKSIFENSNKKVHRYTSPHLVEFNERIVIASEKISDGYLYELCERVRLVSEKSGLEPTLFEATTAAAFLAFAENPADVVILEVGIGGLLDSTNVILDPLLSIITPISFDHMDILGDTIEQIAFQKAGIIKQGRPCVISAQVDEAMNVLLKRCEEVSSPAIAYGYDFGVKKTADGFNFLSKSVNFKLPVPSLIGDHQIINSATVVAALSLGQKVFNFSQEDFARGLQNAYWPARIQKIPPAKYAHIISDQIEIWLDGAHNEHGAKVLANWLKENSQQDVALIFGLTKNRDVVKILHYFKNLCSNIFTVPVVSEPKSYSAQNLTDIAQKSGIITIPCLSLEEALTKIGKDLPKHKILIAGSLYLAADFFKLIGTYSL
jgi:dihydrofolate synthase/folylpolyglutamate synthase